MQEILLPFNCAHVLPTVRSNLKHCLRANSRDTVFFLEGGVLVVSGWLGGMGGGGGFGRCGFLATRGFCPFLDAIFFNQQLAPYGTSFCP